LPKATKKIVGAVKKGDKQNGNNLRNLHPLEQYSVIIGDTGVEPVLHHPLTIV
jgi:hypothetical protein